MSSMRLAFACATFLAACGGEGGGAPQAVTSEVRGGPPPADSPAECRGYEIDVHPNGRAPSALREVVVKVDGKRPDKKAVRP